MPEFQKLQWGISCLFSHAQQKRSYCQYYRTVLFPPTALPIYKENHPLDCPRWEQISLNLYNTAQNMTSFPLTTILNVLSFNCSTKCTVCELSRRQSYIFPISKKALEQNCKKTHQRCCKTLPAVPCQKILNLDGALWRSRVQICLLLRLLILHEWQEWCF